MIHPRRDILSSIANRVRFPRAQRAVTYVRRFLTCGSYVFKMEFLGCDVPRELCPSVEIAILPGYDGSLAQGTDAALPTDRFGVQGGDTPGIEPANQLNST